MITEQLEKVEQALKEGRATQMFAARYMVPTVGRDAEQVEAHCQYYKAKALTDVARLLLEPQHAPFWEYSITEITKTQELEVRVGVRLINEDVYRTMVSCIKKMKHALIPFEKMAADYYALRAEMDALEAAGVDNWGGYEIAMRNMRDEDGDEE